MLLESSGILEHLPKHLDQTKKTQTQTMAPSQQSVHQCSFRCLPLLNGLHTETQA